MLKLVFFIFFTKQKKTIFMKTFTPTKNYTDNNDKPCTVFNKHLIIVLFFCSLVMINILIERRLKFFFPDRIPFIQTEIITIE